MNLKPRWTYACSRCHWIGNEVAFEFIVGIGDLADCPLCGNSCTSDEEMFEPRPGVQNGEVDGFEPVWPPVDTETVIEQ